MANNSVLAKMAVIISAQNADFNRAMSATQKNLSSFTSGITKLAGTLGVAFGTQQIASFALEISKLAGEAEGVRAAFERLPNSTKLMEDLKQATGGTVSELELMKRAVQASNFDISLSALPRLLEFATLRAQQTGQSVDYLVDSIVTGIGRKSKLILDNLGISAVQLNEALGGASTAAASIGEVADAVGRIAEENLKNMAGFSDNAATKVQRLSAAWENYKVTIGEAANGTGVLGTAIKAITDLLEGLSGKNQFFKFGGLEALGIYSDNVEKAKKQLTELEQQTKIFLDFAKGYKDLNTAAAEYNKRTYEEIINLQKLRDDYRDLHAIGEASFKTEIESLTKQIGFRYNLIAAVNKYIATQNELKNTEDNNIVTLENLRAKLDELNSIFSQTDTNDKAKLRNIGDEIRATEALIAEIEALKIARLSATSERALGDQNPLIQTGGVGLTKVTGDLGVGNVADQIELAASRIDSALINNEQSIESWGESMRIHADLAAEEQTRIDEIFQRNAAAAQNFGNTIGQAFGEAASGQKTWAQALQSTIPRLVSLLASEAIASIIVAGSKQGAKTGNAIIGVAAATAGAAAISALLRGTGSNSTGGGFVSSRSSSNNSAITSIGRSDIQDNKIIAETIVRGQDIYVVLKNYEQGRKLTSSSNG